MDFGFRFEIVCYIYGVICDSYVYEVIDVYFEYIEEGY